MVRPATPTKTKSRRTSSFFTVSPLHVSVSLRGKRRFGLLFLGRRYGPLLQQSSAKRLQRKDAPVYERFRDSMRKEIELAYEIFESKVLRASATPFEVTGIAYTVLGAAKKPSQFGEKRTKRRQVAALQKKMPL